MKTFKQCLQGEGFVITAELILRGGEGSKEILQQADNFQDKVSAIQVAEYPYQHDQVSALAAASILVRHGIDSIPDIHGRNRNRIALMSDFLGLRALGIRSIVVGADSDGPQLPEPCARPVRDVTSREIISMAESMNEGDSISPGEEFLIGTQTHVDPARTDIILAELAAHASAGARFLQIQTCYDLDALTTFMDRLVEAQLTWSFAVMITLPPLPSVEAAWRFHERRPGCVIPPSVFERLTSAPDPRREGIAICSEMIREARTIPGVAGVKLISMGHPQDVVESIRESNKHL